MIHSIKWEELNLRRQMNGKYNLSRIHLARVYLIRSSILYYPPQLDATFSAKILKGFHFLRNLVIDYELALIIDNLYNLDLDFHEFILPLILYHIFTFSPFLKLFYRASPFYSLVTHFCSI
jgi:hypothetical protein